MTAEDIGRGENIAINLMFQEDGCCSGNPLLQYVTSGWEILSRATMF
jgi:hypothetical protein